MTPRKTKMLETNKVFIGSVAVRTQGFNVMHTLYIDLQRYNVPNHAKISL